MSSSDKINIHIKFDTGMHRLGFDKSEALELSKFFASQTQLNLIGVASHLLQEFSEIKDCFKSKIDFHILNSSGLIALYCAEDSRLSHFGVRPGIALYGYKPELFNPTSEELKKWETINLIPSMSIVSEIVLDRKVSTGEPVSYNAQFLTEKETLLGVIPIGYADGYRRGLSGKSYVLIGGKRAPICGTICMDHLMVDMSEFERQKEGLTPFQDSVVLMGEDHGETLWANYFANVLNTNTYEILTGWSDRVPRIYND